MEKFKYGPLIWNHTEEEDDSGNYYWSGRPPVGYDEMGIPIDDKGLQCLPLSCPVHPQYQLKHSVFNYYLREHIPSFAEWASWFDENFITIDEARIKREILRWYAKQPARCTQFNNLKKTANSLNEMVEVVWPPEEDK